MVKNTETSSEKAAKIAAKGLRNPSSLTEEEIKTLAGSVLTQTENKKD